MKFIYSSSFFALLTAKSAAKPVESPINASPTNPTESMAIVCATAIAANVEMINAPPSFLAEYLSSLCKYPLRVFSPAPTIAAPTVTNVGSTIFKTTASSYINIMLIFEYFTHEVVQVRVWVFLWV